MLFLGLPLFSTLSGQSLLEQLDEILASPPDLHQAWRLDTLADLFIDAKEVIPDTLFTREEELAREHNSDEHLAWTYRDRYVYHQSRGEFETSLVYVDQAIEYGSKVEGDIFPLDDAYLEKMDILLFAGRTKESADLASALAKKYHDSGNRYAEISAYGSLSTISSGLGNHELTLRYDSIAIALARELGDDNTLSQVLFTASVNLSILDYPEKALALAEESLAFAKKTEGLWDDEDALSARAEANTALGNYAAAFNDFEVLEVMEAGVPITWRMITKGIALQRTGRHSEARKLLTEAATLIKKNSNDPVEFKRCYQALQTIGLNQQQYDTVAWYGKLMAAQQDSLQTAKNIRNILELEEKYKAEEKETEIRLQKKQLALQRNQLYLTIFGLLLALIGGLVFFLLSRRLRKQNAENEQLVTDKETLIGEIHHRVKNNLQVISSLLQLQRRDLESDDDKGRKALLESQNRVSAMGLIHNKLYQGTEVTSVHMPNYLQDLGETLLDAYQLEEKVDMFYDVSEMRLDVDVAIPLGLIINELVTNSMKYAFPKDREGTIEISLHQEDDQIRLAVIDNGVGDAAEKRADSTSFGNNLIGLLTNKLKGTLRFLEGPGYGVEILFAE